MTFAYCFYYWLIMIFHLSFVHSLSRQRSNLPKPSSDIGSLDDPGSYIPLCSSLAPESLQQDESCWSSCGVTFDTVKCDQTVVQWTAITIPSERHIIFPGERDCPPNEIRALCVAQARPIILCSQISYGTLNKSEFCWTDCGKETCTKRYLSSGRLKFSIFDPSQHLKMADCPATALRRRLCSVEESLT